MAARTCRCHHCVESCSTKQRLKWKKITVNWSHLLTLSELIPWKCMCCKKDFSNYLKHFITSSCCFFLLIYFHRSILKSPKSPPILVGDEVLIHDNNRNKQGKMNKNIHQNWKNQINLGNPDNTLKCEISLESQLNNFWTTLSFTLKVV